MLNINNSKSFWYIFSAILILNMMAQILSLYSGLVSQIIIAFCSLVIIVVSITNFSAAILLYVILSLSSIHPVALLGVVHNIIDFGNMRVVGVSLSTIVLLILSLILFLRKGKREVISYKMFFLLGTVIIYSLTRQLFELGAVFYAFTVEFKLIFYFILCLYCFKEIQISYLNKLFFILVIFGVFRSYLLSMFNVNMTYGGQNGFVYDISFVLSPLIPLFVYHVYQNKTISLVVFFVFLKIYFSGSFVISGKDIIVYAFSSLLYFYVLLNSLFHRISKIFILLFLFLIIFGIANIDVFIEYFDSLGIYSISYKLYQIETVIYYGMNINLLDFSLSVGNILAEIYTIFGVLTHNWVDFLFGKGVGGVFPDIYGFLGQSNDAYPPEMFESGMFYRFHTSIAIFLGWFGVVGSLFLAVLLFLFIKNKKLTPILAVFVIMMILYIGYLKEYFIILVLAYYFICNEENHEKNNYC